MKKRIAVMILALAVCLCLPAVAFAAEPITVGDFTIAATDGSTVLTKDTDYTYSNGKLTVTTTTPVTIGMKDGVTTTTETIVVDSTKGEAAVTFDSIGINTTEDEAIIVKGANKVTFTFVGENSLSAVDDGIQKESKTPFVITGATDSKLSIFGAQYGICEDGYTEGGTLAITGSVELDIATSDNSRARGIYLRNVGSLTVSGAPIVNIDSVKQAIYAHGVDISGGTVTLKNDDGFAIQGTDGSSIILHGTADVHILEGDSGVQASEDEIDDGNGGEIIVPGKVTITDSAKLKIYGLDGSNNKITGIKEYAISTTELLINENAVVDVFTQEYAVGGDKTTITGNADVDIRIASASSSSRYALRFSDAPLEISGNATVDIDIDGKKVYGLYNSSGTVNILGSAVVNIKGAYRGIYADYINVSGKAQVSVSEDKNYAIYCDDGAFTISDTATVTASSENGAVNFYVRPKVITVTPALGKVYVIKQGNSADDPVTMYCTERTDVNNKSSAKYFRAEPTDVIPVTISGVEVADKEYDGTPVTRAGTPKAMNGTEEITGLSYTYTWYKNSVSEANKLSEEEFPVLAGKYVLVVAVDGGAFVGQQVIEFTIEQKKIDIPVQPDAVTYNGAPQTYGVTATDAYTVTGGVQTAANEAGYDVTISLTDKANTCWADSTIDDLHHKFIINKKSVTITAEDKSAYVGNKQPELTYTVSGLIGEDELTTEPTLTTNADMKLVGEYTITASGADAGSNYTITHMPGKLTVEQIPVTLYSITKAPCENGKVTVQAVMAAKGSTIKVSAVPAEGYKVVSLTVTDAAGNEIEVVDGRVTMPASDITVSAVFVYDLPYIDVADDNEHYTAIAYMYVNGLMVGTSTEEYIFDGDVTMTRAQIAQILYCLAGKPAAGYAGTFTDVAEGAWYASAVEWAAAEGIVYGVGNDKFAPDRTITTAEMAALIYRYAQCKQNGECTTSDWLTESAEALSWCVDNGILTDTSAVANRYLAAEMFYNMHNLLNK